MRACLQSIRRSLLWGMGSFDGIFRFFFTARLAWPIVGRSCRRTAWDWAVVDACALCGPHYTAHHLQKTCGLNRERERTLGVEHAHNVLMTNQSGTLAVGCPRDAVCFCRFHTVCLSSVSVLHPHNAGRVVLHRGLQLTTRSLDPWACSSGW